MTNDTPTPIATDAGQPQPMIIRCEIFEADDGYHLVVTTETEHTGNRMTRRYDTRAEAEEAKASLEAHIGGTPLPKSAN